MTIMKADDNYIINFYKDGKLTVFTGRVTQGRIGCTVFPDTECFSCGLCNWARQEKEYYEEWLKEQKEYEQ